MPVNRSHRRQPVLVVLALAFVALLCVELWVFFGNHPNVQQQQEQEQEQEQTVGRKDMLDERLFVQMEGLNPNIPVMYKPGRYNRLMNAKPESTQIPGREKQIQAEMQAFIDKITNATAPRFGCERGTTGIVTSCKLDRLCLMHLHMLMHTLNGTVPVELWLERGADAPARVAFVEATYAPHVRVRFFDETDAAYAEYFGPLRPLYRCFFHRKLQALVSSAFERVFWVDRDVLLLRDPRVVLADAAVQRTGTMLWRDMSGILRDNAIWRVMGRAPVVGEGGESGVVYIDKARAWRGLYLAAFMNQAQSTYYRMVFGDKDTFFLAYDRLGAARYLAPFMPIPLGPDAGGRAFVHATPDGRMLFVHLVGGGKKALFEALERGHDAFTTVQLFDPNRAHVSSCKDGVLCIARDAAFTNVRWLRARDVLGDFVTAVADAYHQAAREDIALPSE